MEFKIKCINNFFEKRRQAKRVKKYQKDRKIMRELIEADIAVGAFKMNGSFVYKKGAYGGHKGCQLNQDDMINYICMSVRDVAKEIPLDFKDELDGDLDFNNSFHKTISDVRKKYRDRVELERNIRISKISMWVGITGFVISVIGLVLTIYTMIK